MSEDGVTIGGHIRRRPAVMAPGCVQTGLGDELDSVLAGHDCGAARRVGSSACGRPARAVRGVAGAGPASVPARWRRVDAGPDGCAGTLAGPGPAGLAGCRGAGVDTDRERLAVRLALGFRPLSTSQRQLLEPVSAAALARCGLPGGAVDWYVQAGRQPNACVAGRRTVAVTQGALDSFLAGRLPADLFAAVLVHELGHHATRAGRYGLAASWYAAPGRLACRLVVSLAVLACGGRLPGRATWLVVAVGDAVALVQTAQHRQWLSVAILSAVAFALLVTPVLDGLVSRASEHVADRYTVSVGAGPDLAGALQLLAGLPGARRGVAARLLDRHPSVPGRLARLDGPCAAMPG